MSIEPQEPSRLSDLPNGSWARVVGLKGGRSFQERMTDMGFHIGCTVRVVRGGNGPAVIAVANARVALGDGMAAKILVVQAER